MVLCSVDYIRAHISTILTDDEIHSIITEVSNDVLDRAGTTSETDKNIILAGKNAALAATLRKMKTSGELAARVKQGNYEQQNTIDHDIQAYEQEAEKYIQRVKCTSVSIPHGRIGYGTVNATLSR